LVSVELAILALLDTLHAEIYIRLLENAGFDHCHGGQRTTPRNRTCAADTSVASPGNLDSKQWGLLAIQEGGRRKPLDTFSKETLIRITGRSTYKDKTGKTWRPNDFVLSALTETHDWKDESMVLISSGQLMEQLGLDKTKRRFSFAQLTGSAELQRLVTEAQALKRAEKPLTRAQQEALSVSDRLTLLARVMDGRALLIVPHRPTKQIHVVESVGIVEVLFRRASRTPPDSIANGRQLIRAG
jgi:hypothetical protein